MKASHAPNTRSAYGHTWKKFAEWCTAMQRDPLPAAPEAVADFVVWCLYERQPRCYRWETVQLTLSAIRAQHESAQLPSPVTPEVRRLMRNAKRDLRERPGGKQALQPARLRRMCARLMTRDPLDIRDRAMLLLQFAAGWRRSEIRSLDKCDVRFTRRGLVVVLGASKTDQSGAEGRIIGIDYGERETTCPVRALRAWLYVRGPWDGPLFCHCDAGRIGRERLGDYQINERFKLAMRRSGKADAAFYSSHSLRAGMITTAIEHGASETSIMLRTGQKDYGTLRRYVRSARAFKANPLKGVL